MNRPSFNYKISIIDVYTVNRAGFNFLNLYNIWKVPNIGRMTEMSFIYQQILSYVYNELKSCEMIFYK